MNVSSFTFQSAFDDDVNIFVRKWVGKGTEQTRVIVQIAHGMAEHIDRYDEFAKFLANNGFIVYGNDHRGHGRTMEKDEDFGFLAEKDGFHKAIEDMRKLTEIIEKENPGLPIILFGHSLGSFFVRRYIQIYSDKVAGVVLSGTGGDPGFARVLGSLLAQIERKKNGKKKPSPLLNSLVFGQYNKPFQPSKTDFDWLSSSEGAVEKYVNDPMCGGVCTAEFYMDLFTGLKVIHEKSNIEMIRKDLPIYIFSGDTDPVGGKKGRDVMKVYEVYKETNIENVTCKLYEGGRHEMLNEVNKDLVYTDILQWLIKNIKVV